MCHPNGLAGDSTSPSLQQNLTGIYSWFRLLASHYPTKVHVVESIGRTHSGRNIMAVHVSDWSDGHTGKSNKPKVYLQCLLHASETSGCSWFRVSVVSVFLTLIISHNRRVDHRPSLYVHCMESSIGHVIRHQCKNTVSVNASTIHVRYTVRPR